MTVVYVRREGGRVGADAAVTGLARCGAWAQSAPRTLTRPARCVIRPDCCCCCCQLGRRVAAGGRRVYRGEAAARDGAAKVTICSGGVVRARLARGETGHREQRDRKSIAGGQHAGTPADNYDARVAAGWAAIGLGLHPTRPLPRPNFPCALHLCTGARPNTQQYNIDGQQNQWEQPLPYPIHSSLGV